MWSEAAMAVYRLFRDEYLENGYLHSGMIPLNADQLQSYGVSAIYELVDAGVLQQRNCDGAAYELSVTRRHQLLSENALCSKWMEQVGNAFLEEIRSEARSVSLVLPCQTDATLITVDTLKHQGDGSSPDKMNMACPFEVGQTVLLEYDLPKKRRYSGYSSQFFVSGGVATGEFMVTDIFCNLLVDPPINMIEFQSLSEEFNRIHPDARVMQVFEDVALKRVREPVVSLSDRIRDASAKKQNEFNETKPIDEQTR